MKLHINQPERRNLFDIPLSQEEYKGLEWTEIKAIPPLQDLTPTEPLTPQQLADLPYAGQAEKELQRQGQWDKYEGLEEKKYKVCVDVEYTSYGVETYTVSARSEEEAKEIAASKAYESNSYTYAYPTSAKELMK